MTAPSRYAAPQGIEHLESEVARGLLKRAGWEHVGHGFPRLASALFVFVNGFVTIGLLALLAMVSGTPLVFPSLGPSTLMLFFHPMAPRSSPRNTLCGHAIGIVCGYSALWLMGLEHENSAMQEGVTLARVLAAALALSVTGALIILLGVVHPPAGATTLIVALGMITRPLHLLFIELAVALIVVQALVVNRLAGIDYPLWSPRHTAEKLS